MEIITDCLVHEQHREREWEYRVQVATIYSQQEYVCLCISIPVAPFQIYPSTGIDYSRQILTGIDIIDLSRSPYGSWADYRNAAMAARVPYTAGMCWRYEEMCWSYAGMCWRYEEMC